MRPYAERKAARIERLNNAADRVTAAGNARIDTARARADVIPFGQPILVGHHSERRDRNFRAKIDRGFTKGFEQLAEGRDLARRAEAAEENTAISSDDPEAIDKLKAKLAEEEAAHAATKAGIALARKTLRSAGAGRPGLPREEWPAALAAAKVPPRIAASIITCGWIPSPTNGGANLRRIKERIAELERRAAAPVKPPEEHPGGVTIEESENRVRVYFPGKPPEEVRALLKARGFHFARNEPGTPWQRFASNGAWYAARDVAKVFATPAAPPAPTHDEMQAALRGEDA